MKINPLSEAIRSFNRIDEKHDARGQGRHQGQSHEQEHHEENSKPEEFEVNDLKVEAAIESFQADNQTVANGLHVNRIGTGPGLKVVLKDGTGAIVRQFTGEEFLRLREAVTNEGRTCGKILDRKL